MSSTAILPASGDSVVATATQDSPPSPCGVPLDQVLHGDCTQVLRTIRSGSVDFVITDPPYLVSYRDKTGRKIINDDNSRWMFPAFSELYRVLKPDSYCVSFYGWGQAEKFLTIWKACGFRPVGHFVWVKRYASNARHTRMMHEQAYLLAKGTPKTPQEPPSDVLQWAYTGNRLHPTQKPVSGLVPLLRAFSQPGQVVLDAFSGSGSTAIAAIATRRKFILIEQDEQFCKIARERIEAYRKR